METIYGPGGGKRPSYPTLHSKWNLEHPFIKMEFGFHRRKQIYIVSARIAPYRIRFKIFKIDFGALIIHLYLPIEITPDFNEIQFSRKLGLRAFKQRKNAKI